MESMKQYNAVAKAIRVEYNDKTGEALLIFKITDLEFQRRMLHHFSDDIKLIIKEEKD
jgi:hypothetical protein